MMFSVPKRIFKNTTVVSIYSVYIYSLYIYSIYIYSVYGYSIFLWLFYVTKIV